MRGVGGILALVVGLTAAGQAGAVELDEVSGAWRDPAGGSCEAPYLKAVERIDTPDGRALAAVVQSHGRRIEGDLMLEGRRKGQIVDRQTRKPVVRLLAYRGKLKATPLNDGLGVKGATLEFCQNSRPDYAAGDQIGAALSGGWYEVSQTGLKVFNRGANGIEGCADGGDMAFQAGPAGLSWNRRGEAPRPVSAHPEVFLGKTWLRTDTSQDHGARYISFTPIEGSSGQRMVVANPQTRTFDYYHACPR